jgi:hypothetical protein
MSITVTFIQVDEAEGQALRADPSAVERLFAGQIPPAVPAALNDAMDARIRALAPQLLAGTLAGLDPALRQQLEGRLGVTTAALAAGQGGNEILKLMEQRLGRTGPQSDAPAHAVLSLDKVWQGVHFVLSGNIEPTAEPLGQAVLGGDVLGEEDEGFSGYGPARYLSAPLVARIAGALGAPDLEANAAARFDPVRMSELRVYPGWQASDASEVMDGVRRLRDFYAEAAAHSRAIVTCLV